MVGSDWQCRFSHVWVLAEAEGRLEAASADCQEIDRTIDRAGGARPFDYFWLATWEGAAILHSMPKLISLLEVGATPRGGCARESGQGPGTVSLEESIDTSGRSRRVRLRFSNWHRWLFVGLFVGLVCGSGAAQPAQDSPDLAFRRAPMKESSRSIVIPLAKDLHLAFDAELLRTHTIWQGPGLDVYGPPFTGSKTPFLCTYSGSVLWTMPARIPWSLGGAAGPDVQGSAAKVEFRGLASKDHSVTLIYEVGAGNLAVRIRETPALVQWGGNRAVVRRLEIGPSSTGLWFLAHAEMGHSRDSGGSPLRVVIDRDGDRVTAAARGLQGIRWATIEEDVSYDVSEVAEEEGASTVGTRHVEGHETRCYVWIPPHHEAAVVEIATVVGLAAGAQGDEGWLTGTPRAPGLSVPSGVRQGDAGTAVATRFQASETGPSRVHGDAFYEIEHFSLPEEIELKVTGMDWLPNGNLAVCTWAGEIYVIEQPTGPAGAVVCRRFASGLNEAFGMKVIDGALYVVQKAELTRVTDTDGDGRGDLFETISDDWGFTGNYHAFAFGPVLDQRQNLFVFLTGQRGRWDVPFVGWALRMNLDGTGVEGFASGLRAPNGFGTFGPDDDLFVADNQGNWIGACRLNHVQRGRFYGFPSGKPASEADYRMPRNPSPPAVWFPRKLSPSTSGFVTIEDPRLGPFQGQLLVGDFQNALVMRVFLEKVNGEWQGAVWPFAKGFYSGVNRLLMGPDGRLYVGGLKNRAWAATAPREASLDRVRFTGRIPFEVKEVHATRRGFHLEFTKPVDPGMAGDTENYFVSQYRYEYHQAYGSPEIDQEGKENSSTEIGVESVVVSADGTRVTMVLDGARTGYVTAVQLLDIESADGESIWHDTFYYTLNGRPE